MKRYSLIVILFILVSLFALLPLLQQGFFVSDDGEWMIIRFSAFHQALRDGEIPVRFLGRLNHEYGYPVATFLYPGPNYLAEPLHLIGFSFADSIKILFGLSLILSGIFAYHWLRRFFDTSSAFLGSLVYIYTPYHIYDLYTRGSLGEMVALAVVPFILWQIERQSIFWSALGIGLLILSHNTLATLFLVVIIAYLLLEIYVSQKRKEKSIFSLQTLLLGFGLSSFFWIPALYELQYTVFAKTTVSNWQEYFASGSLIGFSTIAIILFTAVLFLTKRIVIKKHRLTFVFFVLSIFTVFFVSGLSTPLWYILPVNLIQFPFRILSITLICVSFLAACSLSILPKKQKVAASLVLVILLIFSAFPFIHSSKSIIKDDGLYATNMDSTTIHDEYMPVWVKQKPLQKFENKVEIIKGNGDITSVRTKNNKTQFVATLRNTSTIQINTIYWPGWQLTVDGKKEKISYTNDKGLMHIAVPAGTHHVNLSFGETPIRLLADILSIISFIFLVFIVILRKEK